MIVVGIAGLPLIVFWILVAAAILRGREPSNNTARSLTVQAALARVQADLLDADAGARDFLLTESRKGRTRYLEQPYRNSVEILRFVSALPPAG